MKVVKEFDGYIKGEFKQFNVGDPITDAEVAELDALTKGLVEQPANAKGVKKDA